MGPSNNSTQIHIPGFTKQNYDLCCIQYKALLRSQELWELAEKGYNEPKSAREGAIMNKVMRQFQK